MIYLKQKRISVFDKCMNYFYRNEVFNDKLFLSSGCETTFFL